MSKSKYKEWKEKYPNLSLVITFAVPIVISIIVFIAPIIFFMVDGNISTGSDLKKEHWLSFVANYGGAIVAVIAIWVGIQHFKADLEQRESSSLDEFKNRENLLRDDFINREELLRADFANREKLLLDDLAQRDRQFKEENRYRVMPCIVLTEINEDIECGNTLMRFKKTDEGVALTQGRFIKQVFSFECISEYPAISLKLTAGYGIRIRFPMERYETIRPEFPVFSMAKGQQHLFEFIDYDYPQIKWMYRPPTFIVEFKDVIGNEYVQYFALEECPTSWDGAFKNLRIRDVYAPKLKEVTNTADNEEMDINGE